MNAKNGQAIAQTDYINARFESSKLQYAMIISMIFIGPLGLIYGFSGLLSSQDFKFNGLVKIVLAIVCLALVGVAAVFRSLRKYWVFKISITHSGITSVGLFRTIYANWHEIMSIDVISTGILFGGQMIAVRTRPGDFYFPLTMKEQGNDFPKLDLLGEKWVDSSGLKKTIVAENCSLYSAVKNNLNK